MKVYRTPLLCAALLGSMAVLAGGIFLLGVPASLAGGRAELPHPIAGGPFEASAAAAVGGASGVLFASDGDGDSVFWLPLDGEGAQTARAVSVPLGVRVVDPEGLTTDGESFFVVGRNRNRLAVDR